MSKYLTFEHETFPDRDSLLEALKDCGYAEVEEGKDLHLYGYMGDRRDETAEIVVRRNHIGHASNDLGFTLTERGYVMIISEFDKQTMRGGKFVPELRTAYGERMSARLAQNVHGVLTRKVEGSKVKITIRA